MSEWPSDGLTCRVCGEPLAPDSRFCERCGTPVTAQPPTADPRPIPARDGRVGGSGPTAAEIDFDPLANARYQRALVFRFIAVFVAWTLGSLVLFVLFGTIGLATVVSSLQNTFTNFPYGSGDSSDGTGSGAVGVVWFVLQTALLLLLGGFFLLRRIPVEVARRSVTVEGRASMAASVLDQLYAAVTARRAPLRSLRPIRFARHGQEPRNYVQLVDDAYAGFLAAYGFGADLTVGWSIVLSRSPIQWLWGMLSRMFRGHDFAGYGSIGYDQAGALVRLLDAAVREGVDVANGAVEPRGQGLIGTTVPLTTIDWIP